MGLLGSATVCLRRRVDNAEVKDRVARVMVEEVSRGIGAIATMAAGCILDFVAFVFFSSTAQMLFVYPRCARSCPSLKLMMSLMRAAVDRNRILRNCLLLVQYVQIRIGIKGVERATRRLGW